MLDLCSQCFAYSLVLPAVMFASSFLAYRKHSTRPSTHAASLSLMMIAPPPIACRAGKTAAPWAPEMEAEATAFYLSNYIDCFSTPDVDLALAQIPQVITVADLFSLSCVCCFVLWSVAVHGACMQPGCVTSAFMDCQGYQTSRCQ